MDDKPDLFALLVAWQFSAGGMWLIALVAAMLFAYPFSPGYQGGQAETGDLFGMTVGTLIVIGAVFVAIAGAVGLMNRASWARAACVASNLLSLFLVPVGTLFGILALLYLRREDVKDYLDAA